VAVRLADLQRSVAVEPLVLPTLARALAPIAAVEGRPARRPAAAESGGEAEDYALAGDALRCFLDAVTTDEVLTAFSDLAVDGVRFLAGLDAPP
jgi:hypothetical protein